MPEAQSNLPIPQSNIPDEVLLLAEIVLARAGGSNDSQAGTSDEDLLYAIEEALSKLEEMKVIHDERKGP